MFFFVNLAQLCLRNIAATVNGVPGTIFVNILHFSRANGDRESHFPCLAGLKQDWQPYSVGGQSAKSDDMTTQ